MTFNQKAIYVTTPKAVLAAAVEASLAKISQEAASIFIAPTNSREYGCSVENCCRPAYASGLCNAHYMRQRAGKDMMAPVRARKREDTCTECGEKTGAKGGWGLCAKHYKKKRFNAIKDALIESMGCKCQRCETAYHRSVFDFHHLGDKIEHPSSMIINCSIDVLCEELSNCVLLCANCHRLEHYDEI